MKKIIKYFLLILLSIFVFGIDFNNVSATANYLKDSGGNYYFDYVSTLNESYYNSLANLTGDEFREELHTVISTGAVDDFSYDDCRALLKDIDEDINNSNNILCILTGKSMPKDSFGTNGRSVWNREHIWPKSHGFNDEDYSPYTDLHHLRAAEAYTNSTFHNDYDYGVVTDAKKVVDDFGNTYIKPSESSTKYGIFEPRDAVKGDIARMIMYMDIRYEGDSLSDDIQLTITDSGTGPSSTPGYLGDLDTLISWHEEDPVDDLERKRNDKVQSIQGNRNPFIDHPEYANILYGANYDKKDFDEYRVLYYVENGSFTYADIRNYKNNDKVVKPSVNPESSRYDYKFLNWTLSNGEVFDFDNDVITSDLKLYANWEYTPLPVTDMFEMQKTMTGLHLVYENKKCEEKPFIQTTTVTVCQEGESGPCGKDLFFDFDKYLTYNKDDIKITYETNKKGSKYVNAGIIRLYSGGGNGTGLKIESREGRDAKIISVEATASLYKVSDGSTLKSIFSQKIAEDQSYAYLQNISSQTKEHGIDIKKLIITYYVDTITSEPEFENVGLMFGLELENDIYEDLIASGEEVVFGIKIGTEEYVVDVIDLGDSKKIIKEISVTDFNKNYSAVAFVKIDGNTYYAENVSNSVKSIAQIYVLNHISLDVVYEQRVILKYILNS